jgi:hypothetical protein
MGIFDGASQVFYGLSGAEVILYLFYNHCVRFKGGLGNEYNKHNLYGHLCLLICAK